LGYPYERNHRPLSWKVVNITPWDPQFHPQFKLSKIPKLGNHKAVSKRFRKLNGRIFLEAANDSFAPIEVGENQELTIWGAVTYIIHQAK
jgi:hypothetical protein